MRGWVGAATIVTVVGLAAVVLHMHTVQGSSVALPAVMASAQSDSSWLAPSPEEAVAGFVAMLGSDFAGSCAETRSPQDLGKMCAGLMAEREQDGLRAYLIGRTFSEYTTWVFVAPIQGQWSVVATVPLDFASVDPAIPWPP
jgi:hypothetical protein